MRPIPPTESITANDPEFTSGTAKPVAFQPVSNNRLLPTLALVMVAHALIISFLLVQFGWPFGANEDGKSNADPAAIIIPVTLESSETEEPEARERTTESLKEPRADTQTQADQKSENTTPQSTQPTLNDSTQHSRQTTPETQAKEITIEGDIPQISKPSQPENNNSKHSNANAKTSTRTSSNTNNTSTSTKANPAPKPVHLNDSKSGESGRPSDNEANLPLIAAQVDPNYLHRPNPVYPSLSRQRREEGTVLLRVSLDAQGIVRDIAIERSSLFNRLDQAALEAVRQWRFIPARRGSATLPSSVIVPIEFKHQ